MTLPVYLIKFTIVWYNMKRFIIIRKVSSITLDPETVHATGSMRILTPIVHTLKYPGKRFGRGMLSILLCACIIPSLTVTAVAQKNDKSIKLQKETTHGLDTGQSVTLRPEIGARGSFIIPFGDPAPSLGHGYGASLHVDIEPYAYKLFSLRTGISSGFMYFKNGTSNVAATLLVFPQYVYLKFSLQTANGFLAYAKLGGGISVALLDKKTYGVIGTKRAAFDPTAIGGLGFGYNPPKIANLVVFVEGDFSILFEKISGQFLSASLGIAYRF